MSCLPLTIGSLRLSSPLILAPMAGISDLPFRLLSRAEGAPLCFTEMISAQGLIRSGKNTLALLHSTPEDRPLGIQIFGEDPDALAEAARLVAERADVIDINMGCPVKKVVASGAGSALLRDPGKVALIIRAVRKAVSLPLTIKIRTGWTAHESTFLDIARIAVLEGCDAITLHPRTRAQMFSETATWSDIARLKASVPIPVIGSGDVFSADDVHAMIEQTGCDGVMIARGALGNPWIFREASALLRGEIPVKPDRTERLTTALRHLELLLESLSEKTVVCEMRKHVSWYVKGLAGAARFRATVNTITDTKALRCALNEYFNQDYHEQY